MYAGWSPQQCQTFWRKSDINCDTGQQGIANFTI